MKKINIITAMLLALLPVTLLISGCDIILVSKNGETAIGETETRQYDFNDFTRVDISSAFNYEITQSDTYSVSITTNSNTFDDIKITQDEKTLIVGIEIPGVPWAIFNVDPNLKAVITMPQLDSLDSSGATRGSVTGFSSAEKLDVTASGASSVELVEIYAGDTSFNVSGASKVTGDIEAKDMELEVSGASKIQLEGSAHNITADVSGASDLNLSDLVIENASIIMSGASEGTVNLDGSLDVELSGASTLEYIGEPALGITDITGASNLERK